MLNMKNRLYIATFQNNAIETAAKYGVGLEFNHTCISECLDPQNRENLLNEMKKDLTDAGGGPAILHGPFTEIYPSGIDYRARQTGKERLDEAFEVCKALSLNKMVVHNGWLPFIYFKSWHAEKGAAFWQDFMKDKPENFFIYVENVLEDEPYIFAEMMSQISDPRIKLCLDTGHAHAMTQKDIAVETWIETLGPHIGHFHLHNNDGSGDSHGDFDSGTMDMRSVFNAIEKFCPQDVSFTIEARECEPCMKWLKNNLYI